MRKGRQTLENKKTLHGRSRSEPDEKRQNCCNLRGGYRQMKTPTPWGVGQPVFEETPSVCCPAGCSIHNRENTRVRGRSRAWVTFCGSKIAWGSFCYPLFCQRSYCRDDSRLDCIWKGRPCVDQVLQVGISRGRLGGVFCANCCALRCAAIAGAVFTRTYIRFLLTLNQRVGGSSPPRRSEAFRPEQGEKPFLSWA